MKKVNLTQTTDARVWAKEWLKTIKKNPEQPVVISADKNVRYEEVIRIMDMLQQQNIKKIGLLTKVQ